MGSSGEAVTLDFEERVGLMETARKETPDGKLLLVGTGTDSLRQTMKLNQVAAAVGADAALVLPPSYYKPAMTPDLLTEYYSTLARAAKIPILIYSIPQFMGYSMNVSMIAALSRKANIVGLKESSGNISYLAEIIESAAPRFQSITGSALTFLNSLLLGAVGGILALACVAPQESVEIFEEHQAGQIQRAAVKQRRVMKLARAITARYGIAGLKAGVSLAGFTGGFPRAPLRPLAREDQRLIRRLYQEMKRNWSAAA